MYYYLSHFKSWFSCMYPTCLKQSVLLPQLLMCWDYRHIPPHLTPLIEFLALIKETKGKTRQATTLRKRKKSMVSIFGEKKENNGGCNPWAVDPFSGGHVERPGKYSKCSFGNYSHMHIHFHSKHLLEFASTELLFLTSCPVFALELCYILITRLSQPFFFLETNTH